MASSAVVGDLNGSRLEIESAPAVAEPDRAWADDAAEKPSADQFVDVVREEIEAIEVLDPHAAEDGVVGLSFSGGGIRSATFGLGVLEALKGAGLLEKVHYLSTVSGGGYIGAWLSANCQRASELGEPDWRSAKADWSASITHLRRYSNYLSPELGFFSADTWSMFTIWLRNALLVQLTVALCVACVLLVPRLAAWVFGLWPRVGNLRWLGVLLFVLGVVGVAGNLQMVSRVRRIWLLQVSRAWIGGLLSLGCVAAAVAYSLKVGYWPFAEGTINPLHSFVVGLLLVVAGYCALPAGVWLYGAFQPKSARPTQVNYAQRHVQWLVAAPMLLTGFFVAAILWHLRGEELSTVTAYSDLLTKALVVWPFPLAVVFGSLVLLAYASIPRPVRYLHFVLLGAAASVASLHALLCAIVYLLQQWPADGMRHAFVVGPALVLFAFSLAVVVLIGIVGRQSTEGVREWWSRLGAWLLIYGAAWMLVAVAAVYGPELVYAAFRHHFWISLSTLSGWAGTIAAGLMAGHSDRTGRDEPAKGGNALLQFVAQAAPFVFIGGLLVLVATLLDLVVQANTGDISWSRIANGADGWTMALMALKMLAACGAVAVLLGLRVDINEFSLNAFYRNRLVRCFLGATRVPNRETAEAFRKLPGEDVREKKRPLRRRRPHNFTAFDDDDDLALDALAGKRLSGPLHIVNCALNLGGSGDLSLHTRHSASFTLSPLHVGSHYQHRDDCEGWSTVGYQKTADYCANDASTTLGKAISVSGAAASPNMGYHTSPVVAFLLTVFNLRLGWWFPHPGRGSGRSAPKFNLPYMFAELFAAATYRSNFLMVSDGGHFENLAVYELVKRQCRVIIACDGECDPGLKFEGLGSLIRMCEVDLGARICIDVGSLRRRPGEPWSQQRCAVGSITYEDGTTGTLIYLKASMTGLEPMSVLQYKASHPAFPHESTGDQFYAEDQFESYRGLGYHVADRAFEGALAALKSKPGWKMTDLAETMGQTAAPALPQVENFTAHAQSLIGLWNRMRDTNSLSRLDAGMLGDGFAGLAGADRLEAYTCVEMLQLMENVYLDLRLDDTWEHADNQGWRTLFTIWAASPAMKGTWLRARGLFGVRFRYFCERHLGL